MPLAGKRDRETSCLNEKAVPNTAPHYVFAPLHHLALRLRTSVLAQLSYLVLRQLTDAVGNDARLPCSSAVVFSRLFINKRVSSI